MMEIRTILLRVKAIILLLLFILYGVFFSYICNNDLELLEKWPVRETLVSRPIDETSVCCLSTGNDLVVVP